MPTVVICAAETLANDLQSSPLWRQDVDRHLANSYPAAQALIQAARPNLVVVDRDLPMAERLVQYVRGNGPSHGCSVVIVAQGEMQPSEMGLLGAGANAVIRLPPGPEWEERLARLMAVPMRKQIRIHVDLELEGLFGTQAIEGRVVNISRTGMLIESSAMAAVGDELKFRLHLSLDNVIPGVAHVVRIGGISRYGCEFTQIDSWDQRKLELYIEQQP